MSKLRVLVVDDDELVRVQAASLLASAQFIVHQLPSAIGVTRALLQHHIDVVAIDIMLPSLPGNKLAALLRENPRLSQLGVVLMSSRPAEELAQLAEEVAADAVVTKSNLTTELVAAIERADALRRKER